MPKEDKGNSLHLSAFPWFLIVCLEYGDTQEILIAFWILIVTKFKLILIRIFLNPLSHMISVMLKISNCEKVMDLTLEASEDPMFKIY